MKPTRRDYMDMVERIHGNVFLTFSFGHIRMQSLYKVGRHPGWHPIPSHAVCSRVSEFFDQMCKIACNNDPLRGVFRVQFRPL